VSEYLTLITGRTLEQGHSLKKGKGREAYRRATELVEMNAGDMARLGIKEGQVVCLRSRTGQVDLHVRSGELPPGMVFMPMGPAASALAEAHTDGTGMPLLKGLMVQLEVP
jgi:formylmethanofuran dehydrogenase subunit D